MNEQQKLRYNQIKKKERERKRIEGICVWCSRPALYPYLHCEKHLASHQVSVNKHQTPEEKCRYIFESRRKLRTEGRCTNCTRLLDEDADIKDNGEMYITCINCRGKNSV
jgi:hypothetical protein|tara:strand:- start:2188 stop:2517 length:330 start_codon:yes stop_codon:yes gene_type:complete